MQFGWEVVQAHQAAVQPKCTLLLFRVALKLPFEECSRSSPNYNTCYSSYEVTRARDWTRPAQDHPKPSYSYPDPGDEVFFRLSESVLTGMFTRVATLGLASGTMYHSGIYVGNGVVISKYKDGGEAVIKMERYSDWDSDKRVSRVGHKYAAKLALELYSSPSRSYRAYEYDLTNNNCQHFTQYCLDIH